MASTPTPLPSNILCTKTINNHPYHSECSVQFQIAQANRNNQHEDSKADSEGDTDTNEESRDNEAKDRDDTSTEKVDGKEECAEELLSPASYVTPAFSMEVSMVDNGRYRRDSTISEPDASVTSERDWQDDDGTRFFRRIHVICMNYSTACVFSCFE